MSDLEQTLSIIKPDAVERNLIEEIKSIFKKNNLNIKDHKKIHITKDEAAEFYKVHQSKPFYNDLCAYLSSGPIVVMILEGNNAVLNNRKIMGATDPKNAEENTIRKLYGISIDKNSVHGSDSLENAKKEIGFFFKINDFYRFYKLPLDKQGIRVFEFFFLKTIHYPRFVNKNFFEL